MLHFLGHPSSDPLGTSPTTPETGEHPGYMFTLHRQDQDVGGTVRIDPYRHEVLLIPSELAADQIQLALGDRDGKARHDTRGPY